MEKMHYDLFGDWAVSFDCYLSELSAPDEPFHCGEFITACVLRKRGTNLIYSGAAVLHPGEHFDYKKGKKVAFGRAVAVAAPYDKNQDDYYNYKVKHARKVLWELFLAQL
jgi:hypothetical protein